MAELPIVAGAGAGVDATFAESRTRNPGSSRGPPGSPKLMLVLLIGGPGPGGQVQAQGLGAGPGPMSLGFPARRPSDIR